MSDTVESLSSTVRYCTADVAGLPIPITYIQETNIFNIVFISWDENEIIFPDVPISQCLDGKPQNNVYL